jgi:hypothetical protein
MATGDITERYRLRGVNERDGIETRQRGFYVEGLNVDQAKVLPGIPQYGNAHPDYPDLLARTIGAQAEGGGSVVTVSYAPAQYVGGSVPPVNQYAEGFIGVDSTFEDVTVDIPLFELVEHVFDEAGAAVTKNVYQRIDDVLSFQYSRLVHRIPISVSTINVGGSFGTAINVAQLVGSQINKIHTIFGRKLLFKPEGISQRGDGEFKVTYRWYEDPGVPNTIQTPFGGVFAAPNLLWDENVTTLYPVFDDDFILPGFKGLRIIGDADPEQPPKVVYFDKYEEDANGWQNLPGIAL